MANRLLPLSDEFPELFYRVPGAPAPLAGMPFPPKDFDWKSIAGMGFKHVVCLETASPSYKPAPLKVLYAVELDDLCFVPAPRDPKREKMLIEKAVMMIMMKLDASEGVVVHCRGGTGRTGTVIGCVLKKLGYKNREILSYLDHLHKQRGRDGWPEAPWQAQLVQRF